MPRQLRLQYAGAIYHLMSRGNRRQAIFRDDRDRKHFLEILGQACAGEFKVDCHLPGDGTWTYLTNRLYHC